MHHSAKKRNASPQQSGGRRPASDLSQETALGIGWQHAGHCITIEECRCSVHGARQLGLLPSPQYMRYTPHFALAL